MNNHAQTLSQRLAVLDRYVFPVIAAVALTLILSASVRAGTVTFNDLSDTLTTTPAGFGSPSRATFTCPPTGVSITVSTLTFSGEGCTGSITGPSGSTGTLSPPPPCYSFLAGCVTFIWASPGGPGTTREISDVVLVQQVAGVFDVTFVSDPDTGSGEGFGVICSQVVGLGLGLACGPQEDGSSQLAADINWTGTTTVDHIRFESDPVPEPASLALVGSGLLAIAAFRRKRLA